VIYFFIGMAVGIAACYTYLWAQSNVNSLRDRVCKLEEPRHSVNAQGDDIEQDGEEDVRGSIGFGGKQ